MTPVLIDTSVIVALIDQDARLHARCAEFVLAQTAPLITCEAVIAESCHLLRRYHGGAEAVLENIEAGVFQIPFRIESSAGRVLRIIRKYHDREVDLADACLIDLANALGTGDILTLDRDFEIYRWGMNKHFRYLIDRT